MDDAVTGGSPWRTNRYTQVGVLAVIVLCGLSVVGIFSGPSKVVIIAWVALLAMALAAFVGTRGETATARRLVWGYGLASGAMIASASLFLVPDAIGFDPKIGGIGITLGVLLGYGAHTIGHRLSHIEGLGTITVQLSAHSFAGGAIIGLIYGTLPDLGLLVGLSIISHKAPAGYAAARRLVRDGKTPTVLLLPSAAVGLAALPAAMITIQSTPVENALLFGFATGVFLHIAMDFLPQCETGSEFSDALGVTESAAVHAALDKLRIHAVISTISGAVVVVGAWALIS